MTAAAFLLDIFRSNHAQEAIAWDGRLYSYGWLDQTILTWRDRLEREDVPRGAVVSLEADFSPTAIALFLALLERDCVIVPLTDTVQGKKAEFREIAEVERIISIDRFDQACFSTSGRSARHEHLLKLKSIGHPGLVLFSSGSTGKNKAALHDLVPLLEKFKVPRQSKRTITFLLFDHIGGINTMLYTLSNAGLLITLRDRAPDAVACAIEKFGAEILPTSPTFINLLVLSEAYRRYDLSSLELVTYGTEVMPESTLHRFHALFPTVRLQQTYGLSELGILRSKSMSSGSLWVKVGGEGFETRIVDGLLEIKAASAMLGYLNAPSPFTEDGWFRTGDAVEADGEWIRILGRRSEVINVGGEKVYPAEVESVVQQMDGVEDVSVSGAPNPVIGQIVIARVKLAQPESLPDFRTRMRLFCREKLPEFKVPQKVILVDGPVHGDRFKKIRRDEG